MSRPTNQVLTEDARNSSNYYRSDILLRQYLQRHVDGNALAYMLPRLETLGSQAAGIMNRLSRQADQQGPVLTKRTKLGKPIHEIEFHPAYGELINIAARSEMFYVKYKPELRERFAGNRYKMGFAAGQLYAMSELGVYCPLCMTDGAAHLVDRYAPEAIKERLLPKLSAREGDKLYTGAMFLTEKSGGSDVGRNLAKAEHIAENRYALTGEKWFCSNVNADVIMALARTGAVEEGTRGLSLFLVENELPGGRNPMHIIRLKDKLGVRSMATGEVAFEHTTGIRLGGEDKGFKLMAEMINVSRTYNSVAAVAGARRALVEAYEYLNHRIAFGKRAIEHALIRQKFHELISLYIADFLLVWRTIRTMDDAEQGDEAGQQLLRILIPMAKWRTAEQAVYIVRECMELMGGNGYIEDFVMPRLLRDVNVLPIWEGSGNIIVLDMLRAARKSEGMNGVIRLIREAAGRTENYGPIMETRLEALLSVWKDMQEINDPDVIESTARPLFRELSHLCQMVLMVEEMNEMNQSRFNLALDYMASALENNLKVEEPVSLEAVHNLMGWEY